MLKIGDRSYVDLSEDNINTVNSARWLIYLDKKINELNFKKTN